MKRPIISLICAIAQDRGIGKNNKLLVNLPPDLKHFKEITRGHMVIMGQKTYESIGQNLPHRTNVVLTKDKNWQAPNCVILYSLEEALNYIFHSNETEVFFIGGASIYAQAIKYADKLYLTLIDQTWPADTFFPDYSEFKKTVFESEVQNYQGINFRYIELTK